MGNCFPSPPTTTPTPNNAPWDVISTTPSNMPSTMNVRYKCESHNLWTSARHPVMYPDNAHFSPPLMVGHSSAYTMFQAGSMASMGVEYVAEDGNLTNLMSELTMASANVGTYITGAPQFGDFRVQMLDDYLVMSGDKPYVSAITMLAPSPDWFTGVAGFKALDDKNNWYGSFSIETYPWDSGTELGNTFTTMGDMDEGGTVFRITAQTAPATENGVFLDTTDTTVLPVGRFECSLVTEMPAPYDVVAYTPSDVAMTEPVSYKCESHLLWTGARHPIGYPDTAHFSPPIMVGHSSMYSMFQSGVNATPGVEYIAEDGILSFMLNEINASGAATGPPIYGSGQFGNTPVQMLPDNLCLDSSTPYVSAMTMLAPSPDWFTGFNNFKPIGSNGYWYGSFSIETYPWDAGTEVGDTFITTGNVDENIPVFRISKNTKPATANGAFLDPTMTTVLPVGRFTCSLDSVPPARWDVLAKTPSGVSAGTPVKYSCDVHKLWTGARHPIMYPTGAHFSPPVMVGHSMDYTMFKAGTVATMGVEYVAEDGDNSFLLTEIGASSETGMPVSGQTGMLFGPIDTLPDLMVDNSTRYISAITMLAPSPDWFTGFDAFNAVADNGNWYASFSIETYPWDSGTELGNTFDPTGNMAENGTIFRISKNTPPANVNGAFLNPDMTEVYPVSRFVCSMVPPM